MMASGGEPGLCCDRVVCRGGKESASQKTGAWDAGLVDVYQDFGRYRGADEEEAMQICESLPRLDLVCHDLCAPGRVSGRLSLQHVGNDVDDQRKAPSRQSN
ncbi:hypothetical protein HYQ46_004312 [Verticillium longisporum]|nr:hypothetical protein HYQ46_004312 [Verticillium longisporum]